jgi:hypothetical protein
VKTDRRFCEACEVDYCFVNIQLSGVDHTSRKRERRLPLRHPSLTLPARNRMFNDDEARPTVTNGVYRRGCNRLNVPRGTLGITNFRKGGNRPLPNGENRCHPSVHCPSFPNRVWERGPKRNEAQKEAAGPSTNGEIWGEATRAQPRC